MRYLQIFFLLFIVSGCQNIPDSNKKTVVVITNLDEEYQILKSKFPNGKDVENKVDAYKANTKNSNLIILKGKVGSANATAETTEAIIRYNPNYVISFGLAGSLEKKLGIGQLVLVNSHYFGDVDLTNFNYKIGQAPGDPEYFQSFEGLKKLMENYLTANKLKFKVGGLVSTNNFVDKTSEKNRLKRNFPKAIAVDMESAAVAKVCYDNSVPFATLRIISDNASEKATKVYDKNEIMTAHKGAEVLADFLKQW